MGAGPVSRTEGARGGALRRSAGTLAAEVRSGSTSAESLVEASLARAGEAEPLVSAFLRIGADEALSAARRIDERVRAGDDPGPLAGVPVALKDNLCTVGVPTTCASRILEGWVPPYDATVVVKLREAGAVVIGKTNLDEFAMGSSTEHSAFGPTRNPYDHSRVPGGSSGGSAAAVAAGVVPIALGSDTGGSIRQPASFCGVVGLKPTYGLVSRYGLIAFASSLDQIGPFASSVEDAALVLGAIAGADPRDSTCLDRPVADLVSAVGRGVEGLRVGVVDELVEGAAPEVAAAVRQAAQSLASAGAEVGEVSVPACKFGLPAYYLLAPAEASSNLARYDGVRYGLRVDEQDVESMMAATRAAGFGPEVKRRIMLGTFALSAGYYDAYYGQAQRVRTMILKGFQEAYERFDVLLGATSPTAAFELGARSEDLWQMYLSDVFTIPSNLAGHPAISVPWGADAQGLPLSVQLLAPALGEEAMVAAAAVVEAAAPQLPEPELGSAALGGAL